MVQGHYRRDEGKVVIRLVWGQEIAGSSPVIPTTTNAPVVKLVDALVLGTSS